MEFNKQYLSQALKRKRELHGGSALLEVILKSREENFQSNVLSIHLVKCDESHLI